MWDAYDVAVNTQASEVVDQTGHISEGLVCLECGYDLRTLEASADCPECGTPVRVSMRMDGLRDSDADYRAGLARSAGWMFWGSVSTVVLLYVGLAVVCVGVWGVTRREPGRRELRFDGRLRFLARWGITGGLSGSLGAFGGGLILAVFSPRLLVTFREWQPVDVVLVTLHGAMFMGFMVLWEYVSVLARRMEDADLLRRCRRMRWVWVIGLTLICSLALGTSLASWLITSRSLDWSWVRLEAAAAIPVVVMAGVLLWVWGETVVFMRVVRGRLRGICG